MKVLSLFDKTGYMVKPWTDNGHETLIVDIQHTGEPVATASKALNVDLSDASAVQALLLDFWPNIIFGFPPCTDLAVSGARWFSSKAAADPLFQEKAVALARVVEMCGNIIGVPWMLENPVSVLATKWRKPNFTFNPADYGGYLTTDDVHPDYPEYIVPRDAYNKKTCIWCGNGFIKPDTKPVPVDTTLSKQYTQLGGKSLKTKNIRSATPRGFAQAVFETMSNRC